MADPICVFNSVNLAFGFSSLFIGVLAGWISIYFYTQGKKTETEARVALSKITEQVTTLKTITNKHLDKLLTKVTEPDANFKMVLEKVLKIESEGPMNSDVDLSKTISVPQTEIARFSYLALKLTALLYFAGKIDLLKLNDKDLEGFKESSERDYLLVKSIYDDHFKQNIGSESAEMIDKLLTGMESDWYPLPT